VCCNNARRRRLLDLAFLDPNVVFLPFASCVTSFGIICPYPFSTQDPRFTGSDDGKNCNKKKKNTKQSICSVPGQCCRGRFFVIILIFYSCPPVTVYISDSRSICFPRFSSSLCRPSACRRQASNTCATALPRFCRRRPTAVYWHLWITVWVLWNSIAGPCRRLRLSRWTAAVGMQKSARKDCFLGEEKLFCIKKNMFSRFLT